MTDLLTQIIRELYTPLAPKRWSPNPRWSKSDAYLAAHARRLP